MVTNEVAPKARVHVNVHCPRGLDLNGSLVARVEDKRSSHAEWSELPSEGKSSG